MTRAPRRMLLDPPAPLVAPRASLRVELLAAPRVILANGRALLLNRKDAALVALVALDGPLGNARVAALLWPDASQKQADNSLRQRLYRLRRDCGAAVVVSVPLLQLAPGVEIDLTDALQALDGDPAACAGELLGDYDYRAEAEVAAWVDAARQRWRHRRRDALAALASRCEQQGELAHALQVAARLVADEPLHEHGHRRLMRLHYLRGDRAAAVAAFEQCERLLKDELGARPGAETLALLATVERGAPLAAVRPARAPAPASLLRPPRLIGREGELALLDAAHAAGRVFLLLGEAGLGKTRLLSEFAAQHSGCVGAQARPGDAGVPFALLARLLRAVLEAGAKVDPGDETRRELARLLPELGSGLAIGGEGQRLLLQRAVERTLALAAAAGVERVLVDDLHFADAASLEMLQSLVGAEPLTSLRWGFAQRPAEGGAPLEAFGVALEETHRLQRVALAPFGAAQLEALIESLALPQVDAHWVAPLLRHTGGNPLFALETLKDHLLTAAPDGRTLPQPATVGVLIERRLRQLSTPALALARVAAVAGADFSIALAEHVLKTPALALSDAWAELESAQVLSGARFAHDLVLDAVLRSVPQQIARHSHAAVAAFLQVQGAEPAACGAHWERAGIDREAGQALLAAARRALAVGRRDEECRFLERAAACFERAGLAAQAFDARLDMVAGVVTVRGAAAAMALAEQLVAAAVGPQQQAAALVRRAGVLQWLVRAADSARDAERALALIGHDPADADARAIAQHLPDNATAVRAVGILASSLSSLGQAQRAVQLMEAWSARADAVADADTRLFFVGTFGSVLGYANRRREAAAVCRRHLQLARGDGRLDEELAALSNLAATHIYLGQLDLAIAFASDARALRQRLGDDRATQLVNDGNLGWFLASAGRYAEALGLLESALDGLRTLMPGSAFVANTECFLADVMIALGRPARALKLLAQDDAALPGFLRAKRVLGRVRADRLTAMRPSTALTDALALSPGDSGLPVRMALRLEIARAEAPAVALEYADGVAADARRTDAPLMVLAAQLRRIDSLKALGRVDEAAAESRALVVQLDHCKGPGVHPPEALLICHRALLAAGASDDAKRALAAARAWVANHAWPQVPALFRESFLHRHPVHREVLTGAQSIGLR